MEEPILIFPDYGTFVREKQAPKTVENPGPSSEELVQALDIIINGEKTNET